MQSIFRLPWCSEQLKMGERAPLDKMRPAPTVEIPMLNTLKRKFSDCPDVPSPQLVQQLKKQRSEVEYPQQLPTPSSPFVNDARMFPQAAAPQHVSSAAPASTFAIKADPQADPEAQATSGAERCDTKPAFAESHPDKVRADSGSGGYFSSKPVHQHDTNAPNTMLDPLSDLTPLQQVIENEFNMQILMKHNELRLIEQELAKCQVALEQLRRCELRPYPGTSGPDLSVSAGTGPAIAPAPGHSRPSHAPAYGVVDGPYSRHYRQWLLRDPLFDSMSPQQIAEAERAANANRPVRHAGHARKPASKSLATNTRAADPLQSIPNYPAAAVKDKNAPLVLRRSTDNKLVKLICNHCKRFNFSSIQGFLNHCRIAHKNDYKSHDAAAIDCGHALDETELANLPTESHAISAPKPAPTRTHSIAISQNKDASTFVHPLNTPAATPVNTPGPRATPHVKPVATPMPNLHISTPQSQSAIDFKPAANMPRLSAHFAKHKLGGDLAQAVASAKEKVVFNVDEEAMSPETPDVGSPMVPFQGGKRMQLTAAGAMRPGTQDGQAVQRPESRKGFRQGPQQRPRPAPLAAAPPRENSFQSTLSSPHDLGSATFSPNAVDTDPGLVSDHDDDDHASGSDEENSEIEVAAPRHPLPQAGRSCEDHMEIEVQEDDEMDQHGVIIRRHSMSPDDARAIRVPGTPSRKIVSN